MQWKEPVEGAEREREGWNYSINGTPHLHVVVPASSDNACAVVSPTQTVDSIRVRVRIDIRPTITRHATTTTTIHWSSRNRTAASNCACKHDANADTHELTTEKENLTHRPCQRTDGRRTDVRTDGLRDSSHLMVFKHFASSKSHTRMPSKPAETNMLDAGSGWNEMQQTIPAHTC